MIYYDSMNYIMLRKAYSDKYKGSVIDLLRVKNGQKIELLKEEIPVKEGSIYFKVNVNGRETKFYWCMDGQNFIQIGDVYDTSEFSDEYCKTGEFTGTFLGIGCVDALLHENYADFDYFDYEVLK